MRSPLFRLEILHHEQRVTAVDVQQFVRNHRFPRHLAAAKAFIQARGAFIFLEDDEAMQYNAAMSAQ